MGVRTLLSGGRGDLHCGTMHHPSTWLGILSAAFIALTASPSAFARMVVLDSLDAPAGGRSLTKVATGGVPGGFNNSRVSISGAPGGARNLFVLTSDPPPDFLRFYRHQQRRSRAEYGDYFRQLGMVRHILWVYWKTDPGFNPFHGISAGERDNGSSDFCLYRNH